MEDVFPLQNFAGQSSLVPQDKTDAVMELVVLPSLFVLWLTILVLPSVHIAVKLEPVHSHNLTAPQSITVLTIALSNAQNLEFAPPMKQNASYLTNPPVFKPTVPSSSPAVVLQGSVLPPSPIVHLLLPAILYSNDVLRVNVLKISVNVLQYAIISLVRTVPALPPEANVKPPQAVRSTSLSNVLMVVASGLQPYVLQVLSVPNGNHISVLMGNARVTPLIAELLKDVRLLNPIDVLI